MMNLDTNTLLASQSFSQTGFDAAAKTAARGASEDQLDIVAKDFEAMFLAEMMKPMFEGLEVDEQFGGGKGEEVFRGLMIQEYGKGLAETGQIGIAQAIKAQLLQMQEQQEQARTGSAVTTGPAPSQQTTSEESVSYDTTI